ncbi:MAG: hypothetical protein PHE58_00090 [Candidatus Omnitrophica bacterium]|nr:hypothetical protein [Candidatus Omnitrophota bacterium]
MEENLSLVSLESKPLPRVFDLAILWNWAYDREFIMRIHNAVVALGLKPYFVQPFNVDETIRLLKEKQLEFLACFDRASDTDYRFSDIVHILQEQSAFFVNGPEQIKWIDDKILIHMDFIFNKIPVPPTFIYFPTDERRVIQLKIKQLGLPFVVKPAHGVDSGGAGVLLNARSVDDVYQWHSRYKDFIFLLQKQIVPCVMDTRLAWFRVFNVMGKTIPCWWDPCTHIYCPVTEAEIKKFQLQSLAEITKKIGRIFKLGFFSTEIAIEKEKELFVVDYINDQCDMRRKSQFPDGICDEVVDYIAGELAAQVYKKVKHKPAPRQKK